MTCKSHLVEFGKQLRSFRTEKQLSLRELAKRAAMHHPNIAAIEAGRLAVGEDTASRLARALMLSASEKERLVLSLVTPKPRPSEGSFPKTLGLILGSQLRMAGIDPGRLTEFIRYDHPAGFEGCSPFTLWVGIEKGCKLSSSDLGNAAAQVLRKKRKGFVLLVIARINGTLTVLSAEREAG